MTTSDTVKAGILLTAAFSLLLLNAKKITKFAKKCSQAYKENKCRHMIEPEKLSTL